MALREELTRWLVDDVMDSERRPLRPIGASAGEVAARTDRLLAEASGRSGFRVFSGVAVDSGQAPITHAISAGRLVLLVESVAWPSGTYSTMPDGSVLCDGTYIGQSIRPLVGAVRRLQRTTPRGYRIGAIVVVHPSLPVAPTLPAASPAGVSWLSPASLAVHLRRLSARDNYCQSDNNSVTLSWPLSTLGSEGGQ